MMKRRISLADAKARYVHRFTMDHLPQWAIGRNLNGAFYAPQYRSDQEWYDNSIFPGEPGYPFSGWMDGACFSHHPTFPLGMFLDRQFNIRQHQGESA